METIPKLKHVRNLDKLYEEFVKCAKRNNDAVFFMKTVREEDGSTHQQCAIIPLGPGEKFDYKAHENRERITIGEYCFVRESYELIFNSNVEKHVFMRFVGNLMENLYQIQ